MIFSQEAEIEYALKAPYPAQFVIPFPYYRSADIQCAWRRHIDAAVPYWETHWFSYGADYTASPPGDQDTGGTLTFNTQIPTAAQALLIRRRTKATQEVDLHNGTRLDAGLIEDIADKLTMITQEYLAIGMSEVMIDRLRESFSAAIQAETNAREAADGALQAGAAAEAAAREEIATKADGNRYAITALSQFIISKLGPLDSVRVVTEARDFLATEDGKLIVV
jgi:hypothetical protein